MVFIPSTCSKITSRVSSIITSRVNSRISSRVSSRIWHGAIWHIRHLRADSVVWLSHTSSVWPWSGAPKVRLYDTFLGGLHHLLAIYLQSCSRFCTIYQHDNFLWPHCPLWHWTCHSCLNHPSQQYQNNQHCQLVPLVSEKCIFWIPSLNDIRLDLTTINFILSHVDDVFLDKETSMTKCYLKQENSTLLKYINSSPWATLSGMKLTMRNRNEEFLPNSYTLMRQELYPIVMTNTATGSIQTPKKWHLVQMWATNMRWGGTILISSLPHLVSKSNSVIGDRWLSCKSGLKEESCKMTWCSEWLFIDVILSPWIHNSMVE